MTTVREQRCAELGLAQGSARKWAAPRAASLRAPCSGGMGSLGYKHVEAFMPYTQIRDTGQQHGTQIHDTGQPHGGHRPGSTQPQPQGRLPPRQRVDTHSSLSVARALLPPSPRQHVATEAVVGPQPARRRVPHLPRRRRLDAGQVRHHAPPVARQRLRSTGVGSSSTRSGNGLLRAPAEPQSHALPPPTCSHLPCPPAQQAAPGS